MYRKILYGSLLLTLILCTLSARPHPQEPSTPQQAPVTKAESRSVLLPVAVRDKKGAAAEVKLSELELVDEGQPQIIQTLTRDPGQPLRVGLLVDTSRSMNGALDDLRKGAKKLLDGLLPAETSAVKDEAFLIHFDRQVELLEDFSSSRERLQRELEQMETSRVASRPQFSQRNGGDPGAGSGDERGRGPEGGSSGGPEGERSSRRSISGPQLYDAIYLASDELMKSKGGRKALIVFSDGVDQGSKVSLNDAVDAADRAGVSVCVLYFKGEKENAEFGKASGRSGGIGGWPGGGYPGGGRRTDGEEKSLVDGKKILEKIAQRTGGRFYEAKKRENLEEIYPKILDDLRSLYWLTYTPSPVDKEGGFHKVALHCSKSDREVSTREGYYAGAQ